MLAELFCVLRVLFSPATGKKAHKLTSSGRGGGPSHELTWLLPPAWSESVPLVPSLCLSTEVWNAYGEVAHFSTAHQHSDYCHFSMPFAKGAYIQASMTHCHGLFSSIYFLMDEE